MLPIQRVRRETRLSERDFSKRSKVSRLTLRAAEQRASSISVQSLAEILHYQERELILLASCQQECLSEYSTAVISTKVQRDGFDSWKIYYFELVDEFRRTLDPQLLLLPPVQSLDSKLKSLLASVVLSLCEEAGIDAPSWSTRSYYLDQPWFLSETESLKATALVESPVWFRKNNIFVLENFLKRA